MADDRLTYSEYTKMIFTARGVYNDLMCSVPITSLSQKELSMSESCEHKFQMLLDRIPTPPLSADTSITMRFSHTMFMNVYSILNRNIISLAQKVSNIVVRASTIAPVVPVVPSSEEIVYNFILKKFSVNDIPDFEAIISYKQYKRWLESQTPAFKSSKTPYDVILHWVTIVNRQVLYRHTHNCDMERIILLNRHFPKLSLMNVKEIVFPLYQEWQKTSTIPPKTNRWQKMKMFTTEYQPLLETS